MITTMLIFGFLGIISWGYFIAFGSTDILSFIFSFMFGAFCTFTGLIFCSISTIKLIKKRCSVVLYTTCAFVNVISVVMMVYSFCCIAVPEVWMSRRSANIAEIEIALELYKKNHSGELPVSSTWCDLLINDQYLSSSQLTIPSKNKMQRSYALNAGVLKHSEMPDDIVLIFESGPGWNLVGGKELLVKDNYKGGCLVIFGNSIARYINPEDFDHLRWE